MHRFVLWLLEDFPEAATFLCETICPIQKESSRTNFLFPSEHSTFYGLNMSHLFFSHNSQTVMNFSTAQPKRFRRWSLRTIFLPIKSRCKQLAVYFPPLTLTLTLRPKESRFFFTDQNESQASATKPIVLNQYFHFLIITMRDLNAGSNPRLPTVRDPRNPGIPESRNPRWNSVMMGHCVRNVAHFFYRPQGWTFIPLVEIFLIVYLQILFFFGGGVGVDFCFFFAVDFYFGMYPTRALDLVGGGYNTNCADSVNSSK